VDNFGEPDYLLSFLSVMIVLYFLAAFWPLLIATGILTLWVTVPDFWRSNRHSKRSRVLLAFLFSAVAVFFLYAGIFSLILIIER
jgi:hypothetical protein